MRKDTKNPAQLNMNGKIFVVKDSKDAKSPLDSYLCHPRNPDAVHRASDLHT